MKLIRDNIPGMPDDAWETVSAQESLLYLKKKLDEEVQEIKDSNYKDASEYADVLEVLMELAYRKNIDWTEIEFIREEKEAERGGFSNKILKN